MVEEYRIRLANISDIEKVFELSNNDIVRENSINQQKITWGEHKKWFNQRIKNIEYPFYIVENRDGEFIAQVRFDKKYDEVVISLSIVESHRGMGLGEQIIKKCVKMSGINKLSAYIFDKNIASIKSFERAGFNDSHLLKFEYVHNRNK